MRITSRFLTMFFAAAVAVTLGQGPQANGGGQGQFGGHGRGHGAGQPQLEMATLQEISGAVTAVNLGAGTQYPSIEVGGKLIRVAPIWFLLENDFEISRGDQVVVGAVLSTSMTDPYLHAVWIRNETTEKQIQLRGEAGSAGWARRRGGFAIQEPQGNRLVRGGCGFSAIETVSGAVLEVSVGAGIRQPNVILQTLAGPVSVKVGPSRVLLENEFQIAVGDTLTVVYGVSTCTDEKVALQLTNGDVTITLRNEDGSPAW